MSFPPIKLTLSSADLPSGMIVTGAILRSASAATTRFSGASSSVEKKKRLPSLPTKFHWFLRPVNIAIGFDPGLLRSMTWTSFSSPASVVEMTSQ